jgi:hypothetical protein
MRNHRKEKEEGVKSDRDTDDELRMSCTKTHRRARAQSCATDRFKGSRPAARESLSVRSEKKRKSVERRKREQKRLLG